MCGAARRSCRPASSDSRNLTHHFSREKLLQHFAESTPSDVTFPPRARFRLEWVAGSSAQRSHGDPMGIQRGSNGDPVGIEPRSHRDHDLSATQSSTERRRGMMHRAGRDSELVDGQRPRGDVREGMSALRCPRGGCLRGDVVCYQSARRADHPRRARHRTPLSLDVPPEPLRAPDLSQDLPVAPA